MNGPEWDHWHIGDDGVYPCCPDCGAPAPDVAIEPDDVARPGQHLPGCRYLEPANVG
jgi:hypothetical protein